MPYVFAFMRAVRESDLPAVTRHVLLTLASLADLETGVIPDRWTPSLSDLRKATGLARSTVAEHLTRAESDGWVRRVRPDVQAAWRDREKTRYALVAPSPGDGLVQDTDQTDQDTPGTTSPPAGLPSPGDGLEVVRQPDWTSPPAGHVVPTTTTITTTSPTERFAQPNDNPNGGKILKDWIDYCTANNVKLPKRLIGQYAKAIKEALDEHFTEKLIKHALAGMLTDNIANRPSLLANRLVAAQMGPERNTNGRRNGGLGPGAVQPRRSPGAERFERGMALAAQLDAELAARQAAAGGTR